MGEDAVEAAGQIVEGVFDAVDDLFGDDEPNKLFTTDQQQGRRRTLSEMFELAPGGIGVMPDPQDNPDNHVVPHHDSGTQISFELAHVGDAGGVARVGVEIDGNFVVEWSSESLNPGETAVGYVSLGRLDQGSHKVLIYVNPGSGTADHQENTFEVN